MSLFDSEDFPGHLILFGRFEPTTDPEILRLPLEKRGRTHMDFVLYQDQQATVEVSRRVWFFEMPRRSLDHVYHNCARHILIWLNDLPLVWPDTQQGVSDVSK